MEQPFDLVGYWELFDEVVERRYKRTFTDGFRAIDARFEEVRSGSRLLTVDDVMAIFSEDLPYVRDWTKPDRDELTSKMRTGGRRPAAVVIDELGNGGYKPQLVQELVDRFRELTLTALVLHHAYPQRFAMCSHHLASLLNVTGGRVPEYYIEFCRELGAWSKRNWPTKGELTVVQTEFALWTWYRLAFIEGTEPERREHSNRFYRDPWVQRQRASRIGKSLGAIDALELAVAFIETKPTIAAFMVLRELELAVRVRTHGRVRPAPDKRYTDFSAHVNALMVNEIPFGMTHKTLLGYVKKRNEVAHEPIDLESSDALAIVEEVTPIVMYYRNGDA